MALKLILTLGCLSMLLALSRGHIGGNAAAFQNVRPQYYCGRTLARAIALICYDVLPGEKRSSTGTMYNALLPANYKEQEMRSEWPRIAQQEAHRLGLPSRGKRYIVNECCDKACSVEELLSYCA
ncbi:insulin-related peptide 1-like [Bicyclus anynana]|uniref:Insulin-related peptide 1-like n=1 Tax=Bicyclus anynana TaxID=110368 RepID=A0A6J1NCI2_BICAN|nr:insulin-related peptide 1-like [Bicyclus anynana]